MENAYDEEPCMDFNFKMLSTKAKTNNLTQNQMFQKNVNDESFP